MRGYWQHIRKQRTIGVVMGRPAKYDWANIRADLELGESKAYVHKKYNVPYNAINNHLKGAPIGINAEAQAVVEEFSKVTEQIKEIVSEQPEVGAKVLDLLEEKHPQFKKQLATLTSNMLTRANQLVKDADAIGINHLAKGIQTTTDTAGITQRHSPRAVTTMNVQQNSHIVQAKGDLVDFLDEE